MKDEKKTENIKKEDSPQKNIFDMSRFPKNEKGRYVVPDEFLEEHYRDLPDGTVNQSSTRMVYCGGVLSMLQKGKSTDIQKAGGYALQAKLKQRRTFAETLQTLLAQPSKSVKGVDTQTELLIAAVKGAAEGNPRLLEFIRDTIGQKPVDRSETEITGATPAQMALITNVYNRLQGAEQDGDGSGQVDADAGPAQIADADGADDQPENA